MCPLCLLLDGPAVSAETIAFQALSELSALKYVMAGWPEDAVYSVAYRRGVRNLDVIETAIRRVNETLPKLFG